MATNRKNINSSKPYAIRLNLNNPDMVYLNNLFENKAFFINNSQVFEILLEAGLRNTDIQELYNPRKKKYIPPRPEANINPGPTKPVVNETLTRVTATIPVPRQLSMPPKQQPIESKPIPAKPSLPQEPSTNIEPSYVVPKEVPNATSNTPDGFDNLEDIAKIFGD